MNSSNLQIRIVGFSLVSGCCLGLIGLLAQPAAEQSHGRSLPTSGAILGADFRSDRRVSDDGTIPPNALRDAISQRRELETSTDGGGVHPSNWTFHGPTNIGGRVREILIHPGDPNIMWTGSCSGGIWKTTDGGSNWSAMDDYMAVMPIGCMALHPTNPDVLFAGTGEGFFETEEGSSNTAAVRGLGIWKSVDGGLTWDHIPSTSGPDWYFVNRIAIHPQNGNLMLAATSSGVWRSTDGGTTWTRTLTEFAYDARFHPTDQTKAIVGVHDHGAAYSTDGGLTWTDSTGLGTPHRTEIRYSKSNPNSVYALGSVAGLLVTFKSTNGGVSFTQVHAGGGIQTYEAYNNVLWVSPTNENIVIVGGVYLFRSTNGGASYTQSFNNVHADMHAIVEHPGFNGSTNRTVYFGTDGGIYRAASEASATVTSRNNGLGITQHYGAVFNESAGKLYCGNQDNGTWMATSLATTLWSSVFGGDGGYCAYDPTDANYWYGEVQYARIFRSTNGGSTANYIYNGIADSGIAAQINFIPYFALDPNNSNTMLVAARNLWRSTNVKAGTPTWTAIKPTIEPPGRAGKTEGNAHFATNPPWNISTITVAQGNSNLIYVGYNNGQIWKTTNGTAASPTWTRLDTAGVTTPARWVSTIVIHPLNHNDVWVAYMGYNDENVWHSTNGGTSWTESSGNLPFAPVSGFQVHPVIAGRLYAGTDVGLFTSGDGGVTWSTTNQGPSIAPVEQLHWATPNKLVSVTHGRGTWSTIVATADDPLAPDSFSVSRGVLNSCELRNLYASDDKTIQATADMLYEDSVYPLEVEHITHSPFASAQQLSFTVETRSSMSGLRRTIQVWNVNTGQFEIVHAAPSTTTDQSTTVVISSNANRFINSSNREIKFRTSWEPWLADIARPFTANIDRVLVTVQP